MTKKEVNPKVKNIFFQASAIVILLSAMAFYFAPSIAKYAMIVGVAGFVTVVFTTPYPGKSIKGKRLTNLQAFAAILMAISAYLMCVGRDEWVLALLAAALLTLYCAIVIPRIYKKEEEGDKKKEE